VTQRELQSLARIEARETQDGIHLAMDGQELTATFDPGSRLAVTIWSTGVNAALAGEPANATLSNWLGRPVRLVHMDARAERAVAPEWAGEGVPVAFADGFPILITTTGSLADLNRTLAEKGQEPVGMDRFRTNILID